MATASTAVTTYHGSHGETVGTPAIDSNLLRDVYVTSTPWGNGAASGAQVQNICRLDQSSWRDRRTLLAWLWIGGLIVGLGSALSFLRRRHSEERCETHGDDHVTHHPVVVIALSVFLARDTKHPGE